MAPGTNCVHNKSSMNTRLPLKRYRLSEYPTKVAQVTTESTVQRAKNKLFLKNLEKPTLFHALIKLSIVRWLGMYAKGVCRISPSGFNAVFIVQ